MELPVIIPRTNGRIVMPPFNTFAKFDKHTGTFTTQTNHIGYVGRYLPAVTSSETIGQLESSYNLMSETGDVSARNINANNTTFTSRVHSAVTKASIDQRPGDKSCSLSVTIPETKQSPDIGRQLFNSDATVLHCEKSDCTQVTNSSIITVNRCDAKQIDTNSKTSTRRRKCNQTGSKRIAKKLKNTPCQSVAHNDTYLDSPCTTVVHSAGAMQPPYQNFPEMTTMPTTTRRPDQLEATHVVDQQNHKQRIYVVCKQDVRAQGESQLAECSLRVLNTNTGNQYPFNVHGQCPDPHNQHTIRDQELTPVAQSIGHSQQTRVVVVNDQTNACRSLRHNNGSRPVVCSPDEIITSHEQHVIPSKTNVISSGLFPVETLTPHQYSPNSPIKAATSPIIETSPGLKSAEASDGCLVEADRLPQRVVVSPVETTPHAHIMMLCERAVISAMRAEASSQNPDDVKAQSTVGLSTSSSQVSAPLHGNEGYFRLRTPPAYPYVTQEGLRQKENTTLLSYPNIHQFNPSVLVSHNETKQHQLFQDTLTNISHTQTTLPPWSVQHVPTGTEHNHIVMPPQSVQHAPTGTGHNHIVMQPQSVQHAPTGTEHNHIVIPHRSVQHVPTGTEHNHIVMPPRSVQHVPTGTEHNHIVMPPRSVQHAPTGTEHNHIVIPHRSVQHVPTGTEHNHIVMPSRLVQLVPTGTEHNHIVMSPRSVQHARTGTKHNHIVMPPGSVQHAPTGTKHNHTVMPPGSVQHVPTGTKHNHIAMPPQSVQHAPTGTEHNHIAISPRSVPYQLEVPHPGSSIPASVDSNMLIGAQPQAPNQVIINPNIQAPFRMPPQIRNSSFQCPVHSNIQTHTQLQVPVKVQAQSSPIHPLIQAPPPVYFRVPVPGPMQPAMQIPDMTSVQSQIHNQSRSNSPAHNTPQLHQRRKKKPKKKSRKNGRVPRPRNLPKVFISDGATQQAVATQQSLDQGLPTGMTPAGATVHIRCELCDKDAIFLCSICQKIAYCSHSCQFRAWKTHKLQCSS